MRFMCSSVLLFFGDTATTVVAWVHGQLFNQLKNSIPLVLLHPFIDNWLIPTCRVYTAQYTLLLLLLARGTWTEPKGCDQGLILWDENGGGKAEWNEELKLWNSERDTRRGPTMPLMMVLPDWMQHQHGRSRRRCMDGKGPKSKRQRRRGEQEK